MNAGELLVKLIDRRDIMKLSEAALCDEPSTSDRCCIHVESRAKWEEQYGRAHENGFYEPPIDGRNPHISIFRNVDARVEAYKVAQESNSPLDELITLAHELGHHDSWLAGYRAPLTGRTDARLAEPEAAYAEEVRAWHFARHILATLELEEDRCFDEWHQFGIAKRAALRSYQRGLRLRSSQVETIECIIGATFRREGELHNA